MKPLSPTDRWSETISDFEDYLFQLGRSRYSIDAYRLALRDFGEYYRSELNKRGPYVSKLTDKDMQAFVDHLRYEKYLATSSVNTKVAALKAFSRYALEKKLHRSDFTKDLKTSYVKPASKTAPISKSDVKRLISAINPNAKNGLRDIAIIRVMLQCGLRVNEIHALCVSDVNTLKAKGQVRVGNEPKRVLPLDAATTTAIKAYLSIRGAVKGSDPLFLSQHGKPIATKSIKHLIKKYLCMAGRPDLSARDFRHSLGRALYQKTKDLPLVQRTLGHRNIATTIRYAEEPKKNRS